MNKWQVIETDENTDDILIYRPTMLGDGVELADGFVEQDGTVRRTRPGQRMVLFWNELAQIPQVRQLIQAAKSIENKPPDLVAALEVFDAI